MSGRFVVILFWLSAGQVLGPGHIVADDIVFSRDVLPILSEHCFHCHGPDAGQRQADLRLDTESGAAADSDS